MSDFFITIMAIMISFFLGNIILAVILRGFLMPYLKAKRTGGVLLRVHRPESNLAVFRVGEKVSNGVYNYVDGKGADGQPAKKVFSPVDGCFIRCLRVWMADVNDNETAPFIYKKVIPIAEEREVEKTVDGKKTKVKEAYVKYNLFEGYNDSSLIASAFDWCLMRPKRKLGMKFNTKNILFILGGLAVVIYFMMSMLGGGSVI